MDATGGSILIMALEGAFYFALVFVIEKILQMGSITKAFSGENKLEYTP